MYIDFKTVDLPKFQRPELLRHGTIPPPLAGVAPRLIMGQEWWDTIRHQAYVANNMCCYACGSQGLLHAHEVYDIDWNKGTSKFLEVVALCEYSHNFIHVGRLMTLFSESKVSKKEFKKTVRHGTEVLRRAGLQLPYEIRIIQRVASYFGMDQAWIVKAILYADPWPEPIEEVPWQDWRMEFEGKFYPPKFRNASEANMHYQTEE